MTQTKKCNKCNETKPLSEFSKRSDSKDGYRHRCKPCNYRAKGTGQKAAGGGNLPLEPFRKWLQSKFEIYDHSPQALASVTGLDERQIFRVLHREGKTVKLDTVDRALVNEQSTALWELDYTEEDFQRAAGECG